MTKVSTISRRRLLQAGAGAAAFTLAAPPILRAQDVLRFGHLTPRTGFLGPLGEYAAMASKLAVDEINAAVACWGRRSSCCRKIR